MSSLWSSTILFDIQGRRPKTTTKLYRELKLCPSPAPPTGLHLLVAILMTHLGVVVRAGPTRIQASSLQIASYAEINLCILHPIFRDCVITAKRALHSFTHAQQASHIHYHIIRAGADVNYRERSLDTQQNNNDDKWIKRLREQLKRIRKAAENQNTWESVYVIIHVFALIVLLLLLIVNVFTTLLE